MCYRWTLMYSHYNHLPCKHTLISSLPQKGSHKHCFYLTQRMFSSTRLTCGLPPCSHMLGPACWRSRKERWLSGPERLLRRSSGGSLPTSAPSRPRKTSSLSTQEGVADLTLLSLPPSSSLLSISSLPSPPLFSSSPLLSILSFSSPLPSYFTDVMTTI